MRKALQFIHEF